MCVCVGCVPFQIDSKWYDDDQFIFPVSMDIVWKMLLLSLCDSKKKTIMPKKMKKKMVTIETMKYELRKEKKPQTKYNNNQANKK